ncbi:MAG: extracellular solute-binding protein [Clostridia bacterium]|nr:extracellular solute-binding protein [Clostridia bacterium]
MKKTFKSLIALLLTFALICSLAACGGGAKYSTIEDDDDGWDEQFDDDAGFDDNTGTTDNGNASTPTGSTASGTTPTNKTSGTTSTPKKETGATNLSWAEVKSRIPSSAKGKTIEIMDWNGIESVAQVQSIINNFTKETGIKVKFTTEAYDNYPTKIAARVAAGNPPDVVRVREEIPMWTKYLQPVNNLSYNFNDKVWDKAVMNAYTFNGKTYAVNMNDSPYFQPEIVAYNTELIKKYKLEDPYTIWSKNPKAWTWDKMYEITEKFVKAAPAGNIGITGVFGEYAFSCGAPWVSFNGKTYNCNMNNSKFVKAWQDIAKQYQKGLYNKMAYEQTYFNKGNQLFHIDSEINLRDGHFAFKSLKKKPGAIKAVPIPYVKGQSQYYVVMAETHAYGIPQGAKNAELVPYLLRYILDVKNYDMKKFYCDHSTGKGSIYEVVQWCRNTNFRRLSTLSTLMDGPDGYCGYAEGSFYTDLIVSGSIKADLDSKYAPGMKAACAEATKQVAKMK